MLVLIRIETKINFQVNASEYKGIRKKGERRKGDRRTGD
jgi:hypothetical protein